MFFVCGRLGSANFVLACFQTNINSILLTNQPGIAFQWFRFARTVAEWYTGAPISGFYLLQIACVIVLAPVFREILQAAQVACLFDIMHGGIIEATNKEYLCFQPKYTKNTIDSTRKTA